MFQKKMLNRYFQIFKDFSFHFLCKRICFWWEIRHFLILLYVTFEEKISFHAKIQKKRCNKKKFFFLLRDTSLRFNEIKGKRIIKVTWAFFFRRDGKLKKKKSGKIEKGREEKNEKFVAHINVPQQDFEIAIDLGQLIVTQKEFTYTSKGSAHGLRYLGESGLAHV